MAGTAADTADETTTQPAPRRRRSRGPGRQVRRVEPEPSVDVTPASEDDEGAVRLPPIVGIRNEAEWIEDPVIHLRRCPAERVEAYPSILPHQQGAVTTVRCIECGESIILD